MNLDKEGGWDSFKYESDLDTLSSGFSKNASINDATLNFNKTPNTGQSGPVEKNPVRLTKNKND
jgi:hypothetical protein